MRQYRTFYLLFYLVKLSSFADIWLIINHALLFYPETLPILRSSLWTLVSEKSLLDFGANSVILNIEVHGGCFVIYGLSF